MDRRFSVPRRPSFRLHADTIEQLIEHVGLDLDTSSIAPRWVRKSEQTCVEALVEETHAGAIEEQDLDGAASLPEEDEECADEDR